MEDGQIKDSQINASSAYSDAHAAVFSRLNCTPTSGTYGAWCALRNRPNEWIQISFGGPHRITGVVTQGRQDSDQV